jgi:hypothetical protein
MTDVGGDDDGGGRWREIMPGTIPGIIIVAKKDGETGAEIG